MVWAIVFSWAIWKRSWVGHDPTWSRTTVENAIANTGSLVWAQFLIHTTTGLDHPSCSIWLHLARKERLGRDCKNSDCTKSTIGKVVLLHYAVSQAVGRVTGHYSRLHR